MSQPTQVLKGQIPKEQILESLYLAVSLGIDFNQDSNINKKFGVLNFFVSQKLEITATFLASVFRIHPERITEILKKLILLIQDISPTLPAGKLEFEILGGGEMKSTISLSFSSEENKKPSLIFIFNNCNAYEAALQFLALENVIDYLTSLE